MAATAPMPAGARGPAPNGWPAVEPAFGLAEERALRLPERWPRLPAADFLAHLIAREPANLRAHVQRIGISLERRSGGDLYAALLDLFFALGPRGTPLRRRMLRAADQVLAPHHAAFLYVSLMGGLSATAPHPAARGSVLTRSVTGSLTAVSRREGPAPARSLPLEEARTYVAEGDVEAARLVLEEALAADPADADLAGELLSLYRAARDGAALLRMRERLGPQLRDSASWDDALAAIERAGRGLR